MQESRNPRIRRKYIAEHDLASTGPSLSLSVDKGLSRPTVGSAVPAKDGFKQNLGTTTSQTCCDVALDRNPLIPFMWFKFKEES